MSRAGDRSDLVVFERRTLSAAYDQEVAQDSPRLYLRLETDAVDSSGNSLAAAAVGAPVFGIAGPLARMASKAVLLSDAPYVQVTDNALLNTGDTWTIEFLAKPATLGGHTLTVFDKGTNGPQVQVIATGEVLLVKNGVANVVNSTKRLSTSAWWHVAVEKSGATVAVYVNGANVTGPVTNQTMQTTGSDLMIGRRTDDLLKNFDGALGRVALYSTFLSDARILAHAEAFLGVSIGSGQSQQVVISWEPDTALAPRGEIWMEVTRNSETNARFVGAYMSGITPASHRLIWEGIVWTITNATHDRKRRTLFIDSDLSAAVDVTHLQSTEREYIDGLPVMRERE